MGRTGKLRLQISSDEPSIIALGGHDPAGDRSQGPRASACAITRASRSAFPPRFWPTARPVPLKVAIQLSRKAQRNLKRGYNARLSLALVALDVARNQQRRSVKRIVKH